MAYQSVFKRYELKYMLNQEQKLHLMDAMAPHMRLDEYGRVTIRNIYFDTGNYRLIRHSIEKPAYKEKLRLRSYQQVSSTDPVFVELKKKYDSVVYKRRLSMPEEDAMNWICGKEVTPPDCQIGRELEYFRQFYQDLHPAVFLSYQREAYFCPAGGDFRVTLDDTILARREALSLREDTWGTPLLPEGNVLLEVKTGGGIPLWMTEFLTRERIFKTSFSKYGTAYTTMLCPQTKGGIHHA